jgi:hypothetical protein
MADQDTSLRDQILRDLVAAHGGVWIGQPRPILKTDQYGEPIQEQDPFYEYIFPDRSTVQINGAGQIKDINETKPSSVTVRPAPIDQWKPITDPNAPNRKGLQDPNTGQIMWTPEAAAGQPRHAPISDWKPVVDPNDANHKGIQDPNTGDVIWTPEPAAATVRPAPFDQWRPITDPNDPTRKGLQDPNTGQISWTPKPGAPQPKEGDTRDTVIQGQIVRQVYRGGDWIVDPTVAPRPFDTSKAAPKEGDRRQNVVSGQVVTQVYSGGDWVTDPNVPPVPFDPTKPKEGLTRQAIESGYNVTQTYSGGEWVTTSIGTRAVPQPRQAVSASADQPYITQFDPNTNQTVTLPNPNYQPKTMVDVAAQVGRLQQQAQAKRDELSARVSSGAMTPDQAAREFDTWYAQNIESQRATLETIQRQAAVEEQRKQDEATRANLNAAISAGQTAATIAASTRKNMVGPGWGQAVNAIMQAYQTGKGLPSGIDWAAATTYSAPSLESIAQQAVADYLKNLSPTAASLTGAGTPSMLTQPLDIGSALAATQYRPTIAAPAAPIVTTTAAPAPVAVAPPSVYRPPAPIEELVGPARGPVM